MNRAVKLVIPIIIFAVAAGVLWFTQEQEGEQVPTPSPQIIAENLQIPWEVAFLPNGDLLVTERPGTLKRIGQDQKQYPITGVRHQGEGGLLGLALHPRFADNHWLYLYLTIEQGGVLQNQVERYRLVDDNLIERTVIIDKIPAANNHDGGRIAFGPDGYLYITTGDAGKSSLAQDTNSLAGKILRLRDDGTTPTDNPFGNPVYSFGHRNPQGLAWDKRGQLWATEHGRSGVLSGLDELNLIKKGGNYGWPTIQGDEKKAGLLNPIVHSGATTTWAPAGLTFTAGALYFGGLRGEAVYRAEIGSDGVTISKLSALYQGQFGRIRAVVASAEKYLYITTSNTDGRGDPHAGDDKIIRLNLP